MLEKRSQLCIFICVCVYGGQLLHMSKGKPGEKKQNNPDLSGIVASYTLGFCGPSQDRSTWGDAAEDNYRLDTHAGQPLPHTAEACKAD